MYEIPKLEIINRHDTQKLSDIGLTSIVPNLKAYILQFED